MRSVLLPVVCLLVLMSCGCRQRPQSASTPPAPQASGEPETPAAVEAPAKGGAVAPGESLPWLTDLKAGLARAKSEGKPLLVDFYATWCGPCKMLDQVTWPDPQVKAAAAGYVMVRQDVDRFPAAAKQYEVSAVPTIIFMSSDGTVRHRQEGFLEAKDMAKLLRDQR